MTKRSHTSAATVGLFVLALMAGCSQSSATKTSGAASSGVKQVAVDQDKAVCQDLDAVTGLAEKLAGASNAQNLSDISSALAGARDHARHLATSGPAELRSQVQGVADQVDQNNSSLSTARPKAANDPAVQTTFEQIKALYSQPAMTNLLAYRQSHC